MRTCRHYLLPGLWLGLIILSPAAALAQVTTGTIVGTLTDATGQPLPGATVTITESNKNTAGSFVTDETGSYVAPFLVSGTYEVAVELEGFQKFVRQDVTLQVNQRVRINASLEVGTITETTTVVGGAPLVRTESSEVGQVIEERAVRELPLNGRNVATLVYLVPGGVTPGQAGENLSGASMFNPRGASNFNALGQQANANGWLIDGIDNNEFTFNTLPGLYDGRGRTFFFADYAGLNETRGLSFVNTVPTEAVRNGDFSDFRDPTTGELIPIYDPLTTRRNPNFDPARPVGPGHAEFLRDRFPGNVIPPDRIHPVGRNAASIYPLPNQAGNFDNYLSTANREVTENQFTARIDHRFSDRDSIFGRYTYGKFRLDAPQGQAQCCLPTPAEAAARFDLGPFVAGIQNTRLTTQGAAFNYTKVISSGLVNELRIGFARTVPKTFQSDFGHMSAESLGINGINVTEFATGLPNVNVQDFTGLSGGPAFLPVNPKQTHYQIEDALVHVKGRHQLKFGYRWVVRFPSPFTNTDTRSTLEFNRNFTNDPATNTGGTGMAGLLLGHINSGARGFLLEPYTLTVHEHGAFIQDDFKVSPRLTINAGLRYEIFTPGVEEENRLTNFDSLSLRLVYAGENGTTRSANKKTQYNNCAPRQGLRGTCSATARRSSGAGTASRTFLCRSPRAISSASRCRIRSHRISRPRPLRSTSARCRASTTHFLQSSR